MQDQTTNAQASKARLRAIVSVNSAVRCQQPGCGRSIYARVHIVQISGKLMVLGSSCFAKVFGEPHALGGADFGAGSGVRLTDEERSLLIANTEALLARFEAQEAETVATALAVAKAAADAAAEAAKAARPGTPSSAWAPGWPNAPRARGQVQHFATRASPWSWQKERTSVAILTAPSGQHWVRVQHKDGSQKLVPWPSFEGWQSALPDQIGTADQDLGAWSVLNIVDAIERLAAMGFHRTSVGTWHEIKPR